MPRKRDPNGVRNLSKPQRRMLVDVAAVMPKAWEGYGQHAHQCACKLAERGLVEVQRHFSWRSWECRFDVTLTPKGRGAARRLGTWSIAAP